MRGLILVLATPHFVMTESDGGFRLTGLPSGHYTLKAWVDSRTTREQPVDLKSGSTLHVRENRADAESHPRVVSLGESSLNRGARWRD